MTCDSELEFVKSATGHGAAGGGFRVSQTWLAEAEASGCLWVAALRRICLKPCRFRQVRRDRASDRFAAANLSPQTGAAAATDSQARTVASPWRLPVQSESGQPGHASEPV